MLQITSKNNTSLKVNKTVFGSKECVFFGFILNEHGQQAAEHNMTPIEKIVAPEDKSELRRVLGLCEQHKDAVPEYTIIVKPLLTRTDNMSWEWTEECNKAFETLWYE